MCTENKLSKIGKKEQFYKEIKAIIEENVSKKINLYGFSSDLRKDTEEKINEFLKNQTIVSKTKRLWDDEVFMYIMGEILSKYIKFNTNDKDEKIEKLSQIIYRMFLYGGSSMCSPDVALINCSSNWKQYLVL